MRQLNKLSLPEWFYENYLKNFTFVKETNYSVQKLEVELTPREAEVTACLLNGRVTSTIASLLSISPRTVEGYINSVMSKLGCNSRQLILPLLERSGRFSLFRAYYLNLLAKDAFEKGLKRLAFQIKNHNLTCILIYWQEDSLHQLLISQLTQDLTLAGIKSSIKTLKDPESLNLFLDQVTSSENEYLIYMGPETVLSQIKIEMKKRELALKNSLIIIYSEEQESNNKGEKNSSLCVTEENYYESLLNLLKTILPNINIKEVFSEVIRYKEEIQNEVEKSFPIKLNSIDKTDINNGSTNYFPHNESNLPVVILDRPIILKKMDEILKIDQGGERVPLVVLVGIGGAGKTMLAQQFEALQDESVFSVEINAETKGSLITSFQDIANKLVKTTAQKSQLEDIHQSQNSEEREMQLLAFIKNWLKEQSNWLLIYNNVEALADIKRYFPVDPKIWGKGKVIITTRNDNIKNTNFIAPENIIEVEELKKEEALKLFSRIFLKPNELTYTQDFIEDTLRFLEEIPPFPLDISIAAYYIKNTKSTYDKYLENIKNQTKYFERTQEDIIKATTYYERTRYGIITTSINELINVNSLFKEMLFFICILGPQNIPKSFLDFYRDSTIADSLIYHLRKHSLILDKSSINEAKFPTFSIHRSIQAICLSFLVGLLTDKEKQDVIEKSMEVMDDAHEEFRKNCTNVTVFPPHLESIIKTEGVPKNTEANLMTYLGDVYVVLSDVNEAIKYCKQSIELCKFFPKSEILLAKNLQIIGTAYRKKNNFKEAKKYFEEALSQISKADQKIEKKKEVEAEIYVQLGILYNVTFLNKDINHKSEKYILKALKILNASNLFSKESNEERRDSIDYLSRHRLRLAEVYITFGQYEKAMEEGLEESEYIINYTDNDGHKLDNSSHEGFLKAQISFRRGEILLRKNQLEAVENRLTAPLDGLEKLVGISHTLVPITLRAEARIRLGKLEEAYDDCEFVFGLERKEQSNYLDLTYITIFYHAAIIKYKQNDLQKSAEHFSDFFKQMKKFCKEFLEDKEYKDLESKGVFVEIDFTKTLSKDDIKQYLNRSTQIFSTIYGSEHPFVKDYVMKN